MKSKRALTQREIIAMLRQNQDALQQYKVKRIGLFGSYATGKPHRTSDIDFLVEFEEPTFDNFINLSDYLEKLFGKRVDILTPASVDSIRIKEVARSIRESVVYV